MNEPCNMLQVDTSEQTSGTEVAEIIKKPTAEELVAAERVAAQNMKPGVYVLTNDEYHKGQGISASGLKWLVNASPLHLWDRKFNPDREEKPATDALVFGSVVHTLVLEPETFDQRYLVAPTFNKRTKEGKEQYAELMLRVEKQKLTLVEQDVLDEARKAAASVLAHPNADGLLRGGKAEQSVYWIDPDTGVLCKCRPDYWRHDLLLLSDLKTTIDGSASDFSRAIHNFNYHIQAAYYVDGMTIATGEKYEDFVFFCVEKQPPYAVANYRIDERSIAKGRELYKKALATYARCLQTNTWPGYPTEIQSIDLPVWALR